MIIRKETPSDIEVITEITKLAFENHPHSRNTEQFIINALRAANALTISLVAEIDGKLVGHIAFSPVTIWVPILPKGRKMGSPSDGSKNWYGLGPVSIRPACQKQGIGTKLVNEGLNLLKDLGAEGCVVVGDPKYYIRFGFKSPNELKHEGVPQENFLALPFCSRMPKGTVQFHRAFSATR